MNENYYIPKFSPLHNKAWVISEPYGEYDDGGVHNGLDIIEYPYGSESDNVVIFSIVKSGTVLQVGTSESLGNFIRFYDNDTDYAFTYGHLKTVPNQRPGDSINIDTTFSYMGNTGLSYGRHLHIEARLVTKPVTVSKYESAPRTNPATYLGVVNASYRTLFRVYYWDGTEPPTPITRIHKSHFNWAIYGNKNKQ